VPKPSRLRSVDPTPAPAAQDAARRPSGAAVEAAAPPLGSVDPTPAPAAQGAARGPSGVAVEAAAPPLGSVALTPAPAAQGAPRPRGGSVESVPKRGRRRTFSAAEKLRILRLAAACTKRGDVEALLRRERIYSSHLTAWRKDLELHGSEALVGRKPGRKPKQDAKDQRIVALEQRAARLEAKLSLAEKLIDLQKKVSAILDINLATDGES
jgi:transposase